MNQTKNNINDTEELQVDLRDYLRVIVKRRWTIISSVLMIFICVAVSDFTAIPIYQAKSKLIIEKENPNIMSIQEVMSVDSSGSDFYQTQYKIIESRTIARMVIKRLNLGENKEFLPREEKNILDEFKETVRGTISEVKKSIKGMLVQPKASKKKNQEEVDKIKEIGLVNQFINRVSVSPIRNSRLVDIHFEATDPKLAAEITNTLAQSYIDHNLDVRLQAVKNAMNWMNERIEKEKARVEKAEKALQNYRKRQNIITGFSGQVETVTAQKLAKLNAEVVSAESLRVEAQTKYNQAAQLSFKPNSADAIPEVINNPLIQMIKKQEVAVYGKYSELSKKYGKEHPKLIASQSEITSLEERRNAEIKRIVESLKNTYQVALARELSLKNALERQKTEALELNQKAIEYGILKREVESSREMYELLIKRFKETSMTEDLNATNIRVIDFAEIPRARLKPKVRRDLTIAIIAGLLLGLAFAFTFEYLDNTIKTPDDIEKFLQVPFLGLIPVIKRKSKNKNEKLIELVTHIDSKAAASESFRSVRTRILFSSAEKPPQVILVTSPMAKEGKTTAAANLAVTMAQAGSKVVLVECDMRRPRVHRIMKVSRDQGVSNVLVGNLEINDVVIESDVPNLSVIPCGPIPPNPSELLGSHQMGKFVALLRDEFDRIIIDMPPISAVTDAAIMTNFVDGVVVVVRANSTVREISKNTINQLKAVNAPILGVVLNDVDMEKNAYYYQYYYYSYYYGEAEDRVKKKRRKKRRKNKSDHPYPTTIDNIKSVVDKEEKKKE
jgi:polysaccharide biosynthesis transport protein